MGANAQANALGAERLEILRAEVRRLESTSARTTRPLAFGIPEIDLHLGGGLQQGALHEFIADGRDARHGAAATLFVAGALGRMDGPVVWCLKHPDLFAPALAGAGLHPDRVVYAQTGEEKVILAVAEEALRHAGLAGVVAESAKLNLLQSRRLQLAAEESGVSIFVIRRSRFKEMTFEPTASVTRWKISAVPAPPLSVPGLSASRWKLELLRMRGGEANEWIVEACNGEGYLALAPDVADRSAASWGQRAIAG